MVVQARPTSGRRTPAGLLASGGVTIAELPLVPVPAAPEGTPYRRITVERFAGPCGAVIGGVDLAARPRRRRRSARSGARSSTTASSSSAASRSTPDQQVAFSRRFGPYSPVPFVEPIADHAEVIAVVREATETPGLRVRRHLALRLLVPRPSRRWARSCTRSRCRPYGGDTLWANQYLAFETLSPGLQHDAARPHRCAQRARRVLAEDAGDPRPVRRA